MEVVWTAHPARRRPQDIFLVVAVVMVSAWAVLVTLGSALLAGLAVLILTVSVAPFLFPTRYRLDDDGVEERRPWGRKRRAWRDLRRVQVGPGAALVSPFARKSFLDRQRGVLVYFDGLDAAGRDRVIALLRARIGAPGDAAAPAPEAAA
ncbi:MAG: hypothetical protein H6709_05340 [Kofleriaceae bacterium]|nr:hypothetical protein [Myxococcales bacterium]MCB9559885.1 hypothetical protein [Kofleriaceae bacterium]MCB9571497.1 hypothetical protein [Kofleriaceae bacterium]